MYCGSLMSEWAKNGEVTAKYLFIKVCSGDRMPVSQQSCKVLTKCKVDQS